MRAPRRGPDDPGVSVHPSSPPAEARSTVESTGRTSGLTREVIGRAHAARDDSRRLIETSRALVKRSTRLVDGGVARVVQRSNGDAPPIATDRHGPSR
jgi:hypothetical protein